MPVIRNIDLYVQIPGLSRTSTKISGWNPNWLRAWDFLTRGHAVREVGGLNPGRGTIVGGVFHPTR